MQTFRCNGLTVDATRAVGSTEQQFREDVQKVEFECPSSSVFVQVVKDGSLRMVVSYSRRTLLQTGDGHFTPVGGYHRASDLVLLLDGMQPCLALPAPCPVARFKYPPHWVPLPLLVEAMRQLDSTTNLSRGWMIVQRSPSVDIHALKLARDALR